MFLGSCPSFLAEGGEKVQWVKVAWLASLRGQDTLVVLWTAKSKSLVTISINKRSARGERQMTFLNLEYDHIQTIVLV